jgi:hypothetical protein
MKRILKLAVSASVVMAFIPMQSAQAESFYNYYTTPFEYCANPCTIPNCCHT